MPFTISVCIITKNECDILKGCLEALKPFVSAGGHEIVVCDTGSSDNTLDMCRKYTDNVCEFPWINDFSAARNFVSEHASNDIIFYLDSDEYITSWDEEGLQKILSSHQSDIGRFSLQSFGGEGASSYSVVDKLPRIYNKTLFHLEGKIHEQIMPVSSGPQNSYSYYDVPIRGDHHSYDADPKALAAKSERNRTLLMEEYSINEHDPYVLYQLGQSYYMINDYENALYWYSLALEEDVDPRIPYVTTLVTSYGYCLINLKQFEKALDLEGIYDTFGDKADYVFLMGMIYMNNGFLPEAVREFEKAVTIPTCTVVGANSFRAYHNLGVIYEVTGDTAKAKEYYKKCGDFAPAKERLVALGA